MNICLFYHSLISDWNHGNAHFLRGIISSFQKRNFNVKAFEPENGWSMQNLIKEHGTSAITKFYDYFPFHISEQYSETNFDPGKYLHNADLIIVHEWSNPEVVKKIGEYKSRHKKSILLFHDTHHRLVSQPEEMQKFNLKHYDGVLAFGDVLRQLYIKNKITKHAFTWHEAADTNIFYPRTAKRKEGDLVWIGNWGDDERTEELKEFIINPVQKLGLKACFYGVRYPKHAIELLKKANIEYRGWLPNYLVPEVFAKFRVTVHVPRRPYVESLPGIPTIRPFEAMACRIPLICSPWNDTENLFTKGLDYLSASNGKEMIAQLNAVLSDENLARSISEKGLNTIRMKHTCEHRVVELLNILKQLKNKNIKSLIYE